MSLELKVLVLATAIIAAQGSSWSNVRLKRQTASGTGLGVYHGIPATIQDHISLVAIYVDNNYNCAGTVVSVKWVLTIADGVYGLNPSQVQVCVGCDDATSATGMMMNASSIEVHSNYSYETFDFNFACIKVNGSMSVPAAALPTEQPRPGVRMIVAGWGDSGEGRDGAGRQLREGLMNWLNPTRCNNTLSVYGLQWTDRMACGYDKTKSQVTLCTGDWGVPFFFKGAVHGMFVAAPTQGMCSSKAAPVLMIDILKGVDWVKSVIQT